MVSPRAPLIGPGAQEIPGDNPRIEMLTKVSTFSVLWNGFLWQRHRANAELTVLASAVRSSSVNSPDLTNFNAAAVGFFFNITAVPGVDTVTLIVQFKDPASGSYLNGFTLAALSTIGLRYISMGRGAAGSDITIPTTLRVSILHSAGGAFTYSVGAAVVN